MKNIIFLDIDGVLNCQLHYSSDFYKNYIAKPDKTKGEHYYYQICQQRIALLNELCIEIDACIVVSSTWRLGKTADQLQAILTESGATFKVIDITCHTGYERGTEIAKWLRDNCKKLFGIEYYDFYNYAIIDDDSDILLNQREHFFQTDSYSGLTYNTCYKIKRFLTRKTFD